MDNNLSAEIIDNQQPSFLNNYGYIYLTTNHINGKKYVGQHKSSSFDKNYLGSGKALKLAVEKYGKENFSVELIEYAIDKNTLDTLEIKYIKYYKDKYKNNCYNIHKGGTGGCAYNNDDISYYKAKQKISNAKSNRPRTLKEKEQLDNLHKTNTGKHHTEESKQKSRKSNLGQKRTEITKKHLSENHADFSGAKNPFYGKHHSEKTKATISKNNAKAQKGKRWITNKVDDEKLVNVSDLDKYPNYVFGRLRKSQR